MIIKFVFSRSIILILIFVTGSLMSHGQENEWAKHQIKFSPIRTVNIFSPGFELSYELGYGKFSTQLSGAYLIDIFNIVPRGSNFTGYRVSLEQKYYHKTYSKKLRGYTSLSVGYNHVDMTVYSEFVPYNYLDESRQVQEENFYWDYCDLNRKSIISNVKYGMQISVNHLIFDIAMGIGVIHQNVNCFNKRNPNDKLSWTLPDFFTPSFYNEGKYFVFNLPISFKFGLTF